MNEATLAGTDSLPPALALRVNEVCDRFEAACRAGQAPCIEVCLAGVDATTGESVASFQTDSQVGGGFAFSPDGRLLAATFPAPKSGPQPVKVWDVMDGREVCTLRGHEGVIRSLAFGPGGRLLASGSDDKAVILWDVVAGREALTLRGHAKPVTFLAFSPAGDRLSSASYDGMVKVWDVRPME
jgi:WD40 repeat protein